MTCKPDEIKAQQDAAAYANLKKICSEHPKGRYEIEEIYLQKNPALTASDEIVAVPVPPLRRLIGDLHDEQQVLKALDIRVSGGPTCTEAPDEPQTS